MQDGELSLDATSTLEIGSSGTASAGIITVDPNAELRIGSFIPSDASINISDPVLNNGNIVDVGINLNNVTNNGTIQIEVATLGSISSAGQIDAFGGVTIGPSVTGTVDLSGSADTLDIALGAGATIDAADTPAIAGFGNASGTLIEDAIVLVGVSADNAHYVPIGPAIGTLTLDQGHTAVADLTLVGSYTSDEFTVVADSSGSTVTLNPPCFCEGTRILTRQGEIAVEDLRVGDLVITHPAGMRPICWLGQFGVSLARHPRPEQAAPIRIRRNAMAAGVPKRDLLVSPDHAVFLDGALIQAQALLNGASVTQEFPTRIEVPGTSNSIVMPCCWRTICRPRAISTRATAEPSPARPGRDCCMPIWRFRMRDRFGRSGPVRHCCLMGQGSGLRTLACWRGRSNLAMR